MKRRGWRSRGSSGGTGSRASDGHRVKPLIVHITADYPDAIDATKTRAIAALVEGTRDRFDHRVYSLNRDGSGVRAFLTPGSVQPAGERGGVLSWRYAAPSKGLFLARSMRGVADAILADLRQAGLVPALIHAHKLSFEGIAAQRVAARLGLPFALTLQGNTDQKLIRSRPDLRRRYREIWHQAALIVAFAPWIERFCEAPFGVRAGPTIALPCIPAADTIIAPRETGPRVLSAFRLSDWRNKNIAAVAQACATLRPEFPDLTLEIAGGGSPEDERAVDRALAASGATAFTRRVGRIAPDAIQTWMNSGAVFAMPSRRESFGMVFVEALMAGCPIIYPRGAAVDGYFDGAEFASGVDARDQAKITAILRDALNQSAKSKQILGLWLSSAAADQFTTARILTSYSSATDDARSSPAPLFRPAGD